MSEASPIAAAWATLRQRRRTALIPYLTAGYPDRATSLAALRAADQTADLLEVGVPFSDPLADGPVIQRSSFEALRGGMTLRGTLDLIRDAHFTKPVVLFSYLNPVLRYGIDRLLADAAAAGVAGVLLTDLPAGADAAIEGALAASPLDLIRLLAPTSTPERIREIVASARGFVYLIGRLGVTGTGAGPAAGLAASVERVRVATALPIAVGFGISTAAQARTVGRTVDGVVVGSALVEALGRGGVPAVERLLAELRAALDEENA
ncbi:MAG: tryptophan synthase subunit alpha [Gemmatimonadales bacterium]